METLRLAVMLILITLLILIGNSYLNENKFAVINGNKTMNASTSENITINYPQGFNADNCVPITCGIKASNIGFNYIGKYDDSMDLYWNGFKRTLTLGNQSINLRLENCLTEQANFNYKIVLMKIN